MRRSTSHLAPPSHGSTAFDTHVVNSGFDEGCEKPREIALSLLQGGRIQGYLRMIGVAPTRFKVTLLWGQGMTAHRSHPHRPARCRRARLLPNVARKTKKAARLALAFSPQRLHLTFSCGST